MREHISSLKLTCIGSVSTDLFIELSNPKVHILRNCPNLSKCEFHA